MADIRVERRKRCVPKDYRGDGKLPDDEDESLTVVYEEYREPSGHVVVRKRDQESIEAEGKKRHPPFKFVYGLKDKPSGWYERDYFIIYSPQLIQILQNELSDLEIQLLGDKKIKLYVSDFFQKRDTLKQTMNLEEDLPSTKYDTATASHLKHMWQFLDASLQEVLGRYEAMTTEGCVSWDMLWAFYPPGTGVEYRCDATGGKLCGKAKRTKYEVCRPMPTFIIKIEMWNYNCQTWQPYTIGRSIGQYSGGRKFTSLETHPLKFKSDLAEAEKKFLDNGAWFGKLSMKTRNRFMHYKGLMIKGEGTKEAIDGRVMIDLSSFAKMNPNNQRMESVQPPSEILRNNQVVTFDISADDNRKYAPGIVYGFSFQTKQWGVFDIHGFEEIVFNQLAFDALVLNQARKDIIYGLVQRYERNQDEGQYEVKDEDEQLDPIAGKGSGCIFLCYGPPGTGKTFTAESISEKLRAPLWSLSVSELGTYAQVLEKKLVEVLDVAASWGAILLLDEADVYMEKRTSDHLERNAMTGIFLRNLEYYRGVLFLTTNRVVAFDEAFCSRISMFLYYGKHPAEERQTIWRNLLEPLKLQDLQDHLFHTLASYDLNAREIRNVVQVARTLAKASGESLNGSYLMHSLETLAESIEEMKRVTSGLK